jgi:hypothetical protein
MSSIEVNPLAVLKGLLSRKIMRMLEEPNNRIKIEKLRRAQKWDYKMATDSPKIVNSVSAKVWDLYTSRQFKDEIDMVVRQKVAESLSAQIAQEVMWALLSNINNRLKTMTDSISETNVLKLIKENNDLAQQLTRKLKTTQNEELNNAVSEVADKSTQLASVPNSVNNLGKSFSSFRKESNQIALDITDKNAEVISGVANIVSHSQKVDEDTQGLISDLTKKTKEIAYNAGLSLGFNFSQFNSSSLINRVFEIAKNDIPFAYGLGNALGFMFGSLGKDDEETVLHLADTNPYFSIAFGSTLNHDYSRLEVGKQEKIMQLAQKNSHFARALGGNALRYIETHLPSNSVSKKIEISKLPFRSDIDLGLLFRPQERPIVRFGTHRIHIQGEINAPQVTLEIVHLDIVSIKLDSLSLSLEFSNPEVGSFGTTIITGNLPWKMKYDILDSIEEIKNTELTNRNRGQIKSKHTSKYMGDGYFECFLYLDASADVLSDIGYVTYLLHPTFEKPVYKVHDPKNGFPIRLTVWGEFRIHIKVNYRDGNVDLLSHMLTLNPEAAVKSA